VSDVIKKIKGNAVDHKRKENSNDSEDEHQGWQRSMGWVSKNANQEQQETNSEERRTQMTVKTNTKAGSAVWGG
jgi:hypothetical protein